LTCEFIVLFIAVRVCPISNFEPLVRTLYH